MTSMYYNGWTGGNGIQPAADMALDHINSSGILRDYELKMVWNDTRVCAHKCLNFFSLRVRKKF